MSNFQSQEINIGSVVLDDRSLSNGQYGDKKSIRHVDFDVPFSGTPKVSLGINFLDASSSAQTRIRCIAQNITSKGMDISFTTWNENTVYDVAVDYVAVYNPRFGNSNSNNNNQNKNQYNENENNYYQQQNQQTQSNYHNTNDNESEDNNQQQRRYLDKNNNNNNNNINNNNNNNRNDNDEYQRNQSPSQLNNFNGKNVNIKSNKFNNFLRDNNGKGDMSPTARNNETWTITSANTNNNSGLYYIHNKYNHYLSSNGDRVLVGEKDDSSIWKISQRRPDVYSILNYKNSNYLSATDKSEAKTNVKVVNSWEEFNFNFVQ
ncbi:hypothetical protein ACTFIV_002315 [Dictyostelium citrinum]